MNEPPYYQAVERLLKRLERGGLTQRLELSDQDIADTLWLALNMGIELTPSEKPPQQTVIPQDSATKNQPSESVDQPLPVNIYTPPPSLANEKSKSEQKTPGLPFQAPAAPALPNKLQIIRALRPLMRKVPSPNRRILDVEATINRIVDALIVQQDIWLPITKPEPERWLTLELVVEENRSSFIWRETINELEEVLENSGVFRTVRVWTLFNDEQEKLQLVRRKK